MKLEQIGPFIGINNRLPDTKLGTAEGDFLRNAVNVDLTGAGSLRRRAGTALVLAGGDVHSLWADGDACFYVDGTDLCAPTQDMQKQIIKSDLTPGMRASFARVLDDIYWSNGLVMERITAGVSGPAGVPVPNPAPTVSAAPGGSLPAGVYQIAITAVESREESGATWPVQVTVPENGAISISGLDATKDINVYMTPANGDVLMLVSELSGAATTYFSVLPAFGRQIPTLGLRPMPAGHIVRYSNGRLLVASGSGLYYSEPYAPALFNPMRGYIPFPKRVTILEPVENGVYVVAGKTYWLAGADIDKSEALEVLPYGAAEGSSGRMEDGDEAFWFSDRGMVIADMNGGVKNVQEGTVAVDKAVAGAALYREQDGMRQAITSLFGTDASVTMSTTYMEAEIVRKESML